MLERQGLLAHAGLQQAQLVWCFPFVSRVCVSQLSNYARWCRCISIAEGLTALASAVVRNAPPMLLEVSSGDLSVIAGLGRLERLVVGQLAAAEDWKAALDARKASEEAKAKGVCLGACQDILHRQ